MQSTHGGSSLIGHRCKSFPKSFNQPAAIGILTEFLSFFKQSRVFYHLYNDTNSFKVHKYAGPAEGYGPVGPGPHHFLVEIG